MKIILSAYSWRSTQMTLPTDRQQSCPACGRALTPSDLVDLEPLIDPSVRYIRVHRGEHTFVRKEDTHG